MSEDSTIDSILFGGRPQGYQLVHLLANLQTCIINNYCIVGEMVWYESAKLIHGRQWPLSGSYYDNIFIHYRPRGAWYSAESLEQASSPISIERIKHSQRKMKDTDWDLAWASYEQHLLNLNLDKDQAFKLGKDPYDGERETTKYKHIS